MKSTLSLTLALMLISTLSTQAGDREFSGYGGFHISFYSPDLKFLDDKLQEVTPGFEEVKGPITLWGGGGCGQVSSHWRIGGYGFGGGVGVSGSFQDNGQSVPQDATVGLGGGGFYCEYIAGHLVNNLEGAVGLGIGGIGVTMEVTQYRGSLTWNDLFEGLLPGHNPNSFKISAANGGFFLNPSAGVKYYIGDNVAVQVVGGYFVTLLVDDWSFGDEKIRSMPDVSFNAPSLGINVLFGG